MGMWSENDGVPGGWMNPHRTYVVEESAEQRAARLAKEAAGAEAAFRADLADALAVGTVVTSAHKLRQRRYWEGRKGKWEDYRIPAGETWGEWEGHPATVDAAGVFRVRVAFPAEPMGEPVVRVFVVGGPKRWDRDAIHSATAKVAAS